MKMAFGKHKGIELEEVPLDYLQWVLRAVTNMSEVYRGCVLREVQRRETVSTLRIYEPLEEAS
jgi:uncharacterized protein (DUF3820 family)